METAIQEFWNKIALKLSFEQVNEFLPEFDKGLKKEKEQSHFYYNEGVKNDYFINYDDFIKYHYNNN